MSLGVCGLQNPYLCLIPESWHCPDPLYPTSPNSMPPPCPNTAPTLPNGLKITLSISKVVQGGD